MEFSAALAHLIGLKGRGAQEALARQVGITPQYISRLARGERSGAEEVRRKISSALGYSYDDFLALGRTLLGGELPSSLDDRNVATTGETEEDTRKRSCCVAGVSALPPGSDELFSMAVEVLASGTKYARLLAENIRSLHESIQFTQRIENLEGELAETRQVTINVVERLAAIEIAARERVKEKGRGAEETTIPASSLEESQKTAG